MRAKLKAWAIVDREGGQILYTLFISSTKAGAISKFIVGTSQSWPQWKRLGYDCVPVLITELPPRKQQA